MQSKTIQNIMILDTEQLSALYDRIYNIADKYIKKYNPCNIHYDIEHNRVVCKYGHNHSTSLCCGHCKHWTTTGCTIKSLGCKLFTCQVMVEDNKTKKVFRRLQNFSMKYGLPANVYFRSKEEWLKVVKEKTYAKCNDHTTI